MHTRGCRRNVICGLHASAAGAKYAAGRGRSRCSPDETGTPNTADEQQHPHMPIFSCPFFLLAHFFNSLNRLEISRSSEIEDTADAVKEELEATSRWCELGRGTGGQGGPALRGWEMRTSFVLDAFKI